ncbi:MAG: hypothetical protein NT154_01645 [Verrucomicrobia bacterium]|nr:hypothetical protein [Verrucomicrobiota bacterium]
MNRLLHIALLLAVSGCAVPPTRTVHHYEQCKESQADLVATLTLRHPEMPPDQPIRWYFKRSHDNSAIPLGSYLSYNADGTEGSGFAMSISQSIEADVLKVSISWRGSEGGELSIDAPMDVAKTGERNGMVYSLSWSRLK